MANWFEVDKQGLKALVASRPKSFVLRELVQNAWDEPDVTKVTITLALEPGKRQASLTVEDDAPEGFYDIRHAFTLFADTRKRKDPTKRGRFNLGEKQVLALCIGAEIRTTTAAIRFEAGGRRKVLRGKKRELGSIFTATLPMTRAEFDEVCRTVQTFLPPKHITTAFNGQIIPYRDPLKQFTSRLLTEIADSEGSLRPSHRNTTVEVHEPRGGETPLLFEMGLPVVETGDRWHYNVNQRVPLTLDRDNVKPSYLRDLRADVLNQMAGALEPEECSDGWVQDAMRDERMEPNAVTVVVRAQHGDAAFVRNPRDPQATERAVAKGWTPVSPRAFDKDTWRNIRRAEGVLPVATDIPGVGRTLNVAMDVISPEQWTDGMVRVADLTEFIAEACLGIEVNVQMIESPNASIQAQYGDKTVSFNVSSLSSEWFAEVCSEDQIDLIIHELGHEAGGHLDMSYHEALTRIGARLALMDPRELKRGCSDHAT